MTLANGGVGQHRGRWRPHARQTVLMRPLPGMSVIAKYPLRFDADLAVAMLGDAGIDPEYLELRDAETLRPLARVDRDALLAVAAHVGAARLIDNHVLRAAEAPNHREKEAGA